MRLIALLLLAGFAAFAAPFAGGQEYPSRPVKIVVPNAPAGVSDIAARILGNRLSEFWRHPVLVENRAGAGGLIGSEYVARSAPDGYTLLMGAVGEFATSQHLYSKSPVDPLKDFTAIVIVSNVPMVFAASAGAPFNTIKEMIAYANARREGLAYGTAGIGSLSHLIAERFAFESRTKMVNVPYKGGGPAGVALAGGEVLVAPLAASSAIPYLKSGRVKMIAVTTARRVALAPDWPTVAESGVPGFEATNWTALAAPSGTPRDVIGRINADANRALAMADVRERLAAVTTEAIGSTPEEAAAKIRDESDRYGKLIRLIKVKRD
ncbi:MAG: tripartite tricarboxylate transporter substrate binding protein [Betaproteobacteria bacterium]|nr:tripartite tricarboxylate transporter substrate binding protein [Betaproteobacteria bacterium]